MPYTFDEATGKYVSDNAVVYRPEVSSHDQKTRQLGNLVQDANNVFTGLESQKRAEVARRDKYVTARHEALMEIETIEGYGSGISSELQKKMIDLRDSVKSFELFESGIEKSMPDLDHKINMANKKLGSARSDYQFHAQGGNGATSKLKAELSTKSRTNMSMDEKQKYIKQLSPDPVEGLKLFTELTPLI